jgi:DNA-damage-inducible protein J
LILFVGCGFLDEYINLKGVIAMATKPKKVYAKIEPEIKEQAENILTELGISPSDAINMFYRQIIFHKGIPFEVKIPSICPIDISDLSDEQINEELEKGFADAKADRSSPASEVFDNNRKDYNL